MANVTSKIVQLQVSSVRRSYPELGTVRETWIFALDEWGTLWKRLAKDGCPWVSLRGPEENSIGKESQ